MKQIEINPSNKPYYSKEFVDGFECGTKEQYYADKKVVRQIKAAMQTIENREAYGGQYIDRFDVLQILDELIEKVEETE